MKYPLLSGVWHATSRSRGGKYPTPPTVGDGSFNRRPRTHATCCRPRPPPRQLSGRGYCNQTREEEGEDSVRTEQQCRTRKVMNKEVSRVILARKVAHAAVTRPRIPDATIENARRETWGSQDETAGLTSFLAINLCVVQAAPGQRKMRRRSRRRRQ